MPLVADPFADLPDAKRPLVATEDPFADLPNAKAALYAPVDEWEVVDVPAAAAPKKVRPNWLGAVKNLGREVLGGATFGLSERGEAAARAVGDETYDEALADIRKERAEMQEKHPVISTGAQIAGGIAVPGVGAVRVATHARAAARTAGASTRVGRLAGTAAAGATVGAYATPGTTKDLTDIPQVGKDLVVNTGIGAVAGPVIGSTINGVWGGAKWVGDRVRDAAGRVGEQFGMSSTPAATRIMADVVEGKGVARVPGVGREEARRTAADLDNDIANATTPGVQDSLAIADPRVAALVQHLGSQRWMPDAPFDQFAQRTLHGQTERVAQGTADALAGRPTDHGAFMERLRAAANEDMDPAYIDLRRGVVAGQHGNMQIQGLVDLARQSPEELTPALRRALAEIVAHPGIQFDSNDARRVFGVSQRDQQLISAREIAVGIKREADRDLAQARAHLSDARRSGGAINVDDAQNAFDDAQNAAYHADVAARDATIDATLASDRPRLLTQNMHPAVVERLYHNLSHAANTEGGPARATHDAFKGLLGLTSKGQALAAVKGDHARAFSNLEAAKAGESVWGHQGPARVEALNDFARLQRPQEVFNFQEAAAGAAGARIAGDAGTFARPQNLVGSAENRGTMNTLFGQPNTAAAQQLVEREGNVYDVANRLIHARMGGNQGAPDPDIIGQALKTGIQWKFTPSVAIMGAWTRIMTGITKQRGAAIAHHALGDNGHGIDLVRGELLRRQAARARALTRGDFLSAAGSGGAVMTHND